MITAGCWIVGGYNYLTAYGFQVRPVILAGSHPWAHEVVMETKEHIFVFLPIIAFALSITLSTFDRDTFLGDDKFRRALTMTAVIPVLNKNTFERWLNLLIFRNNSITLSTVQNTNHKARFEY
jgi:hypothetical protein